MALEEKQKEFIKGGVALGSLLAFGVLFLLHVYDQTSPFQLSNTQKIVGAAGIFTACMMIGFCFSWSDMIQPVEERRKAFLQRERHPRPSHFDSHEMDESINPDAQIQCFQG